MTLGLIRPFTVHRHSHLVEVDVKQHTISQLTKPTSTSGDNLRGGLLSCSVAGSLMIFLNAFSCDELAD